MGETKAYTYTPVEETKVYINFDRNFRIVNRCEIHTSEIMRILLACLLSGIKTNRKYVNKTRLINRESAVIIFKDMEAEIQTNGLKTHECIKGIEALIEYLKTDGFGE